MPVQWLDGVRGTQVLPLINLDDRIIRCIAGPGSGKTFGLVRRVERLLHPEGRGLDGRDVLVVAFNRVIARQLQQDVLLRLTGGPITREPVIRTIHGLCVELIGEDLRILLPHEVDAMLYDLLQEHNVIRLAHGDFYTIRQALRDHDAGHAQHPELWMAAQAWLLKHHGNLIGDVPRHMLARLDGGDFPDRGYSHVIVDEFQDLTASEQALMLRLLRPDGCLLALGVGAHREARNSGPTARGPSVGLRS